VRYRILGQIFIRTGNGGSHARAVIVIHFPLGAIPVLSVPALRSPFLNPDVVSALANAVLKFTVVCHALPLGEPIKPTSLAIGS
jgi:hypothetical protein